MSLAAQARTSAIIAASLGAAACHPIWDELSQPMTARNVTEFPLVLAAQDGPCPASCECQAPAASDAIEFTKVRTAVLEPGFSSPLPFGDAVDGGTSPPLCGGSFVTLNWLDLQAQDSEPTVFRFSWDLEGRRLEAKPLGEPAAGMVYLERLGRLFRPTPGPGVSIVRSED